MTDRTGPSVRRLALAAWGTLVLVLTLRPSGNAVTASGVCLICGERGVADAILNIVLFLPLGALLSGLGGRRLFALAAGALLSGAIESIQFFTPGRDASLGDIVFNAAGAGLGAVAWHGALRLAAPSKALARRASVIWAVGLVLSFAALAAALRPRIPAGDIRLLELPPAPEGGRFQGELLEHEIASDGALVRVRFTAVEPRWAFRPIVALLGEDGTPDTAAELGPKGDGLIARFARPVDGWRLTATDLELPGVFTDAIVGDTLTAELERRGDAYCLRAGDRGRCGLGYSVGSGWALLAPTGWLDPSSGRLVDGIWLAALFLPLGFWSRGAVGVAATGFAVASAFVVPAVTPLLAAPAATMVGVVTGILLGHAARRIARSRAND